jgi:hypothetical protein
VFRLYSARTPLVFRWRALRRYGGSAEPLPGVDRPCRTVIQIRQGLTSVQRRYGSGAREKLLSWLRISACGAAQGRNSGVPAELKPTNVATSMQRVIHRMRQYGIDGVFLSRFIGEAASPSRSRHVNQVLANVREGCHREGRVWAMRVGRNQSQ